MSKHARNARYWIDKLKLTPHPEGGSYRQTYRSDLTLACEALPPGFTGPRPASTAIYFLLEGENFSAFHRLRSDELWHFYAGSPLLVHSIDSKGHYSRFLLGSRPDTSKKPCKQPFPPEPALLPMSPTGKALVGCTVAPGFDFADFELADREILWKSYPQHHEIIDRLTRECL